MDHEQFHPHPSPLSPLPSPSPLYPLFSCACLKQSGSLSLEELNVGLELFAVGGAKARPSEDEFFETSLRGKLLNDDCELGPLGFQVEG